MGGGEIEASNWTPSVFLSQSSWRVWLESPHRVSMSQSHHECASWTEEIISGVLVSEPVLLSVSVMAYSPFASCSVTMRWHGEEMWLTWASLRGRSSAACCHDWPSWCRRPGSRRSRPPLCSAAPGPDDRPKHFNFRAKYETTSCSGFIVQNEWITPRSPIHVCLLVYLMSSRRENCYLALILCTERKSFDQQHRVNAHSKKE